MRRLERTSFVPPLRKRNVGGICVSTSVYAAGSTLPAHEHSHAYLCLVADGAYYQSAHGREDECRRGLLFIHPQGHRHSNRFHPQGARSLDVFLPTNRLENAGIRQLLSDYRTLRLPGVHSLLSRLERELSATDEAAGLALESAVLELIAQAMRRNDTAVRPLWMSRVVERLQAQPQLSPSLSELAVLAGVHPSHLARTFRRLHGVTVGEQDDHPAAVQLVQTAGRRDGRADLLHRRHAAACRRTGRQARALWSGHRQQRTADAVSHLGRPQRARRLLRRRHSRA